MIRGTIQLQPTYFYPGWMNSQSRRPQTDIQVRVKELSGEQEFLELLRTTRDAAPLILPDLIALPRSLMEEATNKGLVLPLEDISEVH